MIKNKHYISPFIKNKLHFFSQEFAPHVPYLATRLLSQDHLEAFFGKIRQRGGFNNNPSPWLFSTAYKKILIATEIRVSCGSNVVEFEDIAVLTATSTNVKKILLDEVSDLEDLPAEDYEKKILSAMLKEHEYLSESLTLEILKAWEDRQRLKGATIEYITGFIVFAIERSPQVCEVCSKVLRSETCDDLALIRMKNRGGLVIPSKDTILVCKRSEDCIQEFQAKCANIKSLGEQSIPLRVSHALGSDVFQGLEWHHHDNYPSPVLRLVRLVSQRYVRLRINSIIERDCMKRWTASRRHERNRLTINCHD